MKWSTRPLSSNELQWLKCRIPDWCFQSVSYFNIIHAFNLIIVLFLVCYACLLTLDIIIVNMLSSHFINFFIVDEVRFANVSYHSDKMGITKRIQIFFNVAKQVILWRVKYIPSIMHTVYDYGLVPSYGDIDLGQRVNIVSGNVLLPLGTKPLTEPMVTKHPMIQWHSPRVNFTGIA